MRVNYLGPLCAGIHPAMEGYNLGQFPPSCYLVEVSDEAGVSGPIMEGDLLVVDEAKTVGHADLVVAEFEGEQRLFRTHRIGGAYRLLHTVGPKNSIIARARDLRGVVVSQARRYAM
ncbi:LexA family protein [Halomonas sp. BC04]|uniref:LexA family protein n=1 Tax=Halomonas sp. BC04 TaxID=1403540 RepID=UPI0003ED7727|nr:S24 family peptidase [Halomonas sp. BC04]EWH00554.1 DNA polymerase V [Halomonas sp. BC04]